MKDQEIIDLSRKLLKDAPFYSEDAELILFGKTMYNKAIDDAAENAEATDCNGYCIPSDSYEVDKESILKLKLK